MERSDMKCINCLNKLTETGAATGMGYVYLYYCNNKNCERYQLFTYVGDQLKKQSQKAK